MRDKSRAFVVTASALSIEGGLSNKARLSVSAGAQLQQIALAERP